MQINVKVQSEEGGSRSGIIRSLPLRERTKCRFAHRPREIIIRYPVLRGFVSPAVPNNSHRRQIDAHTSNASVVRADINSRQSRGRDGRELGEVIAHLHARRNLERDTSRFGRGKWQSNDAHTWLKVKYI